MSKLFLGIDDSGRGPVIGPMILAGVLLKEEDQAKLREIGVKDSKLLTHKRRIALAPEIRKIAVAHKIIKVYPEEIDARAEAGLNLNHLEAIKMAQIINELTSRTKDVIVQVDCPSINTAAWKGYLLRHIKREDLGIACEHKAERHTTVAAASILAKVAREAAIDAIKKKYGIEFGSGYPSDPLCKKFLHKEAAKYRKYGIIRETWQTWQTAAASKCQKKLSQYG